MARARAENKVVLEGVGGLLVALFLFQLFIPVAGVVASPQPVVVFTHHGILFTLAPDSISAQYGDEKLTLKFATNKKTLDQCTITPASNGYLMDYGSVQIKVTVPQNKPIIKLTFSGSDTSINQFKVKIFSEDVKTKLIKPLKQEGEKVKGNHLKFDWSDARKYSKSFMGDTLSFSVSGPFDIDPELGVDEGSYQIPFVLWAPNFNTGETKTTISSGTIAEEWSYSIAQPPSANYFSSAYASSSDGILVSYSWASTATTNYYGATTTISKTFNYSSPVNLTFNVKVEGYAYGGSTGGHDVYGYLKVYDGAGTVIYQFGWQHLDDWTPEAVTYSNQTTVTLTNLTQFKVELWTYAIVGGGDTTQTCWAKVSLSQMAVFSPTTNTTINYYANSTGSYYNTTIQDSIGNAYLFLPKGTSVTNVSANYTVPALPGWSYRKAHTIQNATGAGTGYQVRIIVHYGTGTDSGEHVYLNGHCRTDFGDVRFTKADKQTLLSYWMESKTDSDNAVFWVKIDDDLSTNPVTIYIYYGNTDAIYAGSGENTFLFFDDFESYTAGASLPTAKWPYQTAGWKVYLDGTVKVARYEGGSAQVHARAFNSFNPGQSFAVETLLKSDGVKETAILICASNDVSSSYGYYYFLGWGNNGYTAYIYYSAGATGATLASLSNTVPTAYERVTVTHTSDGLMKLIRQGSVLLSATHTTYTSGYVGIMANYGQYPACYVDWIAVRKYVDPEPAHGAWGAEEPVIESGQSTNYILLPYNSTHWILRTPNQLIAGATTIALIKWNATNAVYDLSVSPTTIRPDQNLTVNATLKDGLGNPLNETVNCTILDAQGTVYNYTTGTAVNGQAVLTIQVPHQNGKYYAQVNVITGEYRGVLAVPFTVSDAFTIYFVSESPNTYYKQPGTVVNITVKLLYNADGSPASNLLVKLTDVNGTVLDTDYTESYGYVMLSGVVNETEFTWYITGYTDQSSATYVYDGHWNAIYNTITLGGDLQALEITCNTMLMDGLVVQHAFGFYIAGEGEGSYKLPCNINYSGIRIPYIIINDTSLVFGQNLIITARIENYNPSPVDNVQLVITLVMPFGDTVDTITFAVGTIKPANYVMAQATKTFTPWWSGPYLWLYNFSSSTINFNGSGGLFPLITTSDSVHVKDLAYVSNVWDQEYKFTWVQPNAVQGDYVYVSVIDANKLTSLNYTKIEVPTQRECVLTVSAYPYVVESGMNFTVCANVSFNTPPPYYAITITGEGITHTVYNQNATWVITAPVKPMFALSTLYYDITVKDPNGKEYASTRLSVDVFNYPPKVYLNSPAEGAVVSNVTTFDLDVQDDSGVQEVLWRIDDGAWQNLTAPPYDFSYDTAKLGDGRHILYVKATDNAGFVQIAQFYFYSQNLAEQWKFESALKSILSTAANISFPVLLGFGVVALVLGYALAKIKQKKPQPPIVVQIEQKTKEKEKEKKEGKK